MLARILITVLLLSNACVGQKYEDNIDECNKAFEIQLDSIPIEQLELTLEQASKKFRTCIIGKTFPHFEVTSIEGRQYLQDDLKGKVVFLNFWFAACSPCVAEIPSLNQLNSEYQDQDFLLLSFSTDEKNAMSEFLNQHRIEYPIVASSKNLIQETFRFKVGLGFPTNIILNKKGEIVEIQSGGALEEPGLSKTLNNFKSIIEKELAK